MDIMPKKEIIEVKRIINNKIFEIINLALLKSPEPIYLEIVAEVPIAIPILKLITVKNTGNEKEIAAK